MWKSLIVLAIVCFGAFQVSAQVPEFDQLEMYYAQGHYKKVLRKANKYLDRPEYDYSLLPSYYRALSMFQLHGGEGWRLNHPNALQDARNMYLDIRSSMDGQKVLEAHMYEVASLKTDLLSKLEEYKRMQMNAEFEELQAIVLELFDAVPTIEKEGQVKPNVPKVTEFEFNPEDRNEMVVFAGQQLGTPYVWAGNTPSGFDCSGFTGYVMNAYNKQIPRRAADQYEKSTKLKQKTVQKGDLVFFDNGSGISHVGMIVSEQGAPLVMIHASTSKGIMLTNIEESEYWSKRLAGFGTYLK